jgi:hypothetical protein
MLLATDQSGGMTMKTRILVMSAPRDEVATDVVDQWRQAVMGDARARERLLRRARHKTGPRSSGRAARTPGSRR